MGVAAVDGYGQITQSNAKEIYTAWKRGEVELSASQQKYTESLLTPEEMDEVSYDTEAKKKEGSDKINTDGADNHGGQGGNAAATSVGATAGAAGAVLITQQARTWAGKSGWAAIGLGVATLACAALTKIMVNKYDNAYKDRTATRDAGDETNATIDGAANALLESMDYMNEDMELYQEQSEEYTLNVNTNTSMMADLQVQLADAQSAGDTVGAENIRNQMKSLEEVDMSGQQEEMDETKGRLEEYSSANAESQGISGAGQTVSDFLKEGTALGVVATAETVLLTVATVMSGYAIAKSLIGAAKDASHLDWGGSAAGIAASAIFGVSTALLGAATKSMADKAKNEFECASKGGDIEGHVKALNGMIEEQAAYTETTEESFGATDEESSDSQAEAQEAANKAVQSNTGGAKPSGGKKEDDKKTEKKSQTSGAA